MPGTRDRDKYIYFLLLYKRFHILLNLSWYQSRSDFYTSKYYLKIQKKWFFLQLCKTIKNSGKKWHKDKNGTTQNVYLTQRKLIMKE